MAIEDVRRAASLRSRMEEIGDVKNLVLTELDRLISETSTCSGIIDKLEYLGRIAMLATAAKVDGYYGEKVEIGKQKYVYEIDMKLWKKTQGHAE